MSISLQNAMKIGGLRDCKIVAGHEGVSKIIESVTVMEVPDIVRWLNGNELLLTTLYTVKDDPDAQRSLIHRLHETGATALAIKPYHVVQLIPQVILQEADKLDFPIIEIPEQVSYVDILSPIMNTIFDNKVVLQKDLEQALRILREISLGNKGIDEFINTLSHLTKNAITVESQLTFIKLQEPNMEISPLTEKDRRELAFFKYPIRLNRKSNDRVIPCIVAPIIIDGHVYGSLTCWEVNTDNLEIDFAILEKASGLMTHEFLKLKVQYDVEQQYKNDFIRELLFNESMNEKDLLERGQNYSFAGNKEYVCFLLAKNPLHNDTNGSELTEVNEVNHVIHRRYPGSIVGSIRDLICVIFPIEQSDNKELRGRCRMLLADLKSYVGKNVIARMAVGQIGFGIKGVRRSYFEADQAVKLQNRMKEPDDLIYYADLGVYRLLGQMVDKKELADFYADTIGHLEDYDTSNDLALIDTLKAYFLHDEKLKKTSQHLFIHVNTLKYRLNKMESLTSYSLNQSDGKMMLYLGLKIHEMIKE